MNSKEKEEKNMESHPFYTHLFLSSSFFFVALCQFHIKKNDERTRKKSVRLVLVTIARLKLMCSRLVQTTHKYGYIIMPFNSFYLYFSLLHVEFIDLH